MLKVGHPAPDFTLPDQNGDEHSLTDYKGKKVLLYFYPKDMTSGCTVEAQLFRDNYTKLQELGVEIIGISKDDIKSHKKFVDKHDLPFTLLADTETSVNQAYGVWKEKSMYGKKYMGTQRDSFLIDEDGKLIKHYVKVKPASHVDEVLTDLANL
jgi:peroxiredoxin Q/BCP